MFFSKLTLIIAGNSCLRLFYSAGNLWPTDGCRANQHFLFIQKNTGRKNFIQNERTCSQDRFMLSINLKEGLNEPNDKRRKAKGPGDGQ
jgi:hypothetical protein